MLHRKAKTRKVTEFCDTCENWWKMFNFLIKCIFLSIIVGANDTFCPNKCICKGINQRDELKLRCGESNKKIVHFEEIDLLNIASDVVHL